MARPLLLLAAAALLLAFRPAPPDYRSIAQKYWPRHPDAAVTRLDALRTDQFPTAAIATITCARPVCVAAQTSQPLTYAGLVEVYRHDPDGGLHRALATASETLAAGVSAAVQKDSGWTIDALDAAIVLHTAAALSLQPNDGRAAEDAIGLAVGLADAAARDEDNCWFLYRWQTGLVSALEAGRAPAVAHALSARLAGAPWRAAGAAVDEGRGYELKANRAPTTPLGQQYTDSKVYDPQDLRAALGTFRVVMKQYPHLRVAALHAGRIQLLRQHDDEARLWLTDASQSANASTRYLAHLFLGSLDERQRKSDTAVADYRAAIADVPHAYTARLAAAAILIKTGAGAQVGSVLAPGPAVAAWRRFDPWWTYFPTDVHPNGIMLLSELYAEVGK